MSWEKCLRDFVMLWATIDPVGTVSVFVAVTAWVAAAERRRIALRATLFSAGILVAFIVVGQLILTALDVSLEAFQISGGIILFLFGLQMVFGTVGREAAGGSEKGHDLAVFPLAVPSIASPGAIMAVTLLTDNHRFSIATQAVTAGIMLGVLLITYGFMLLANPIHRLLGESGSAILIRVMGMILAALATESVASGLRGLLTRS